MGKTTHDDEKLILTTKRKLIPSVQRKAPSISPDESNPDLGDSDVLEQPPKKVKKTTKKKSKPAKAAKAKTVPVGSDSDVEVVSGGVVIECVIVHFVDDLTTNNGQVGKTQTLASD